MEDLQRVLQFSSLLCCRRRRCGSEPAFYGLYRDALLNLMTELVRVSCAAVLIVRALIFVPIVRDTGLAKGHARRYCIRGII